MANFDQTEDESNHAWLVCNADKADRYGIVLNISGELVKAIKEGHWLLVADESGQVLELVRIFRIRQSESAITLYPDLYHKVSPSVMLSDVELSLPDAKVSRMVWSDFVQTLPKLGLNSFEDAESIEDHAYVRDLFELNVRDDLLGPVGGPNEFIVDLDVRERYLVGKLAPQRVDDSSETKLEPNLEKASAIFDEDANTELNNEAEQDLVGKHEPGAEFSGTDGQIDAESNNLDEIDTTKNQSLIPSSMGLTFCVAEDVQNLSVSVNWGHYTSVPNDQHEHVKKRINKETGNAEETKAKVWQRKSCGGKIPIELEEGTMEPKIPDSEHEKVQLQGKIRINETGQRIVTLFLVNGQEEPKRNKAEKWLFQPEIIVEAADGSDDKAVFRAHLTSKAVVDDPERDQLTMIYRNRREFAIGHGVSVHAEPSPDSPEKATQIRTEVIPRHELAVTEVPGKGDGDREALCKMVQENWLDMDNLANMDESGISRVFSTLIEDYTDWIVSQKSRVSTELSKFEYQCKQVIEDCETLKQRLKDGLETLLSDKDAFKAFQFANQVMARQRVHSIYALKRRRKEEVELADIDIPKNKSWRPFQLAFLLLSIPSLANPEHSDRTSSDHALADLLWFPTGGGKTEAYLGVAAFTMAIRRLKPDLGGLDASRGLAVIMRYTLRLLTLQQFQRAATLLCAMESIRRSDEKTWGLEPFTLGLWLGNRITPFSVEESDKAVEKFKARDRNMRGIASPVQLTSCPWCGSEISAGREIEVDKDLKKTLIFCSDKYGNCEFTQAQSNDCEHPGIPVKVVDEEIYHRPPSMMIATVDKFAMMSWRTEIRALFGRVDLECERHGLLWPGHNCRGGHMAKRDLPSASVKQITALRPPDLIIQDEFHLISGPLGTMVGLYETTVDELCSWNLNGNKIRPKIIASTATVRRAADQTRNVFMRKVSVFPPSGLDVEDNYFSVQRPTETHPGRTYVGIFAPGNTRPSIMIRVYTTLLTVGQALQESFGKVADPYMTLVGYFNSLRELGGMKRFADDDVRTRSSRINRSLVERPGLTRRFINEVRELNSRVSSQQIPQYLDQLETTFNVKFDPEKGKFVNVFEKDEMRPIDIVLATNMLSVGVDVKRLGIMVVNGQPKGTAEYIQATSRIGRDIPGLVVTVLTWSRPRDISHYESFEHYHATFYKQVEAQSVTPFSPRALDRGLTGAMISLMRHKYWEYSPNKGAGAMTDAESQEIKQTIRDFANRTENVTEDLDRKSLLEDGMDQRSAYWAQEANVSGRTLVYKESRSGSTEFPLITPPKSSRWNDWTVPRSMREVEPGVRLIMEDEMSNNEPDWTPRINKQKEIQSE